MPLFVSKLKGWVHPADLFVGLHANDANAFWLDRESNRDERFSVIGASGKVVSEFGLEWLRREISEIDELDLPFSFRPGYVGYLDFEGKAKFLHVDRALVLDHDAQEIYFIGQFDNHEIFEYWHHAALLRIGVSGGEQAMYKRKNPALVATEAKVRHSDAKYLSLIEKAQNYIAAGDVYQICLTNQISLKVSGNGLTTFLALREANPAPYSAYFRIAGLEIISSSPEQFLKVSKDRVITSKPIKGTRPRHADPHMDVEAALELKNHSKERAENLMIVDLMRNDFGKVAEPESVSVPKLFDVESYATVHQLVSTVQAKLRESLNAVDVLESAFPGGSMTGAPKHRALEIIRELEAGNRGVYSGIIGFVSHGGVAEFGMVIRTVVSQGGQASIGVGGGITIDSIPDAELQETKIKAKALLLALQAGDPWLNW